MKRTLTRIALVVAAALPALAQAHPGHDAGVSFATGASHPLTGLDHLLALIAVGLLAGRMGGRASVAIPAAFLTLLGAGIALGFAGVNLDFVEPAIVASVLVCGALALLPPRHLPAATAALAAFFAVFHGNAHGTEVAAGLGRVYYAAGLMLTSGLVIAIASVSAARAGSLSTAWVHAPRR